MFTVPFAVVTPAILTLSKFVCPSTSKSPFASMLPANVETPATSIPALISIGNVLNVAAVPVTILSVDATPINPDPSPANDVAVITPAFEIFTSVKSRVSPDAISCI